MKESVLKRMKKRICADDVTIGFPIDGLGNDGRHGTGARNAVLITATLRR